MKITDQVAYSKIIDWRIHWLYCDLITLYDSLRKYGSAPSIEEGLKKYNDIVGNKYGRIIWEFKTIMGLDYESEIEPQCKELPAYARFIEQAEKVRNELKHQFENETTNRTYSFNSQLNCNNL